uniref:CCHC-type domain-containing protein n=1 Tax=Solanum lycopersicum TaxID=4081 RepID=A0A3Q7I4E9_SOLLC
MRTKKGRSKSRSRLSKDECAFCREKGHWKKDCPKLNSKAKPNNGKAVMDSNVADYDDSDYSLVITDQSKSSDVWLMDAACKGECGVIHTANNNPLTAYGVGSIRLRNHDGLSRTLKDVRYVPDLKKNLISVGDLESKGFKVIANNGVMRICSGALVVEFEGKIIFPTQGSNEETTENFPLEREPVEEELEDNSFIYFLLYVDDMLIASKSKEEIEKLKNQLRKEFEMKDLGEAKKILAWR